MKKKDTTQKIVTAALFAALTCIATSIIKIPSPLNGYINPGDCVILLAGWMTSPLYSFLAASIGSALADIFSGFILYAPATFIIKGMMAVCAYTGYRLLQKRTPNHSAYLISGTGAELVMILGYFLFEGILYGFSSAMLNIPANGMQGLAGLLIGLLLVRLFRKSGIRSAWNE